MYISKGRTYTFFKLQKDFQSKYDNVILQALINLNTELVLNKKENL